MSESLKGHIAVWLLKLLALLPLASLRALGWFVGRFLWYSNSHSRQITEKNIALCFPEKSDAEISKLAQQNLVEVSKTALESAAIWLWPEEKAKNLIVDVQHEEIIKNAHAAGKGVIIIVPHIGSWEVFSWYFPRVGKTTSLYQPPKLKALDELIKKSRLSGGMDVAPTNLRGVSKIVKTLKAGNMTGILPDQEPEVGSGVFIPFFGVQAYTMTLVSNLARKTGSKVIGGFAERVPGGFKIVFNEVDEEIYNQDDITSLSALNNAVEACIRKAPEQYQWQYKRFKLRPQQKSKFYDLSIKEMRAWLEQE